MIPVRFALLSRSAGADCDDNEVANTLRVSDPQRSSMSEING